MRAEVAAAERAKEVRDAAQGWRRAGFIGRGSSGENGFSLPG